MNAVQVWAAAVCSAVLVAALLQYFSPGGSMDRVFRMVLAAFAVLSFLSPMSALLQSDFSQELRAFQSGAAQAQFEELVDTQITEALSVNLKSLVAAELAQQGLAYQKMDVKTDIGEDGRIVINRIVVVLPRENAGMCLSAAARLESALGIRAEVTVDGAGETGEDVF